MINKRFDESSFQSMWESFFSKEASMTITEKYISSEYISQGRHLVLKDKSLIEEISKKVARILQTEKRHPNKFEQHITSIYEYLVEEME